MRGSFLLASVVLASAALPTSAAQSAPPGQLQEFAKCAVQHYDGAELLATTPGSAEEADVLAEFGRRGCSATGQPAPVLRGALAEQLFNADFGSIGAQPRREIIEVFRVDPAELAELDAPSRRRVDLVAFGTCVAATDRDKTAAYLKTAGGSAEEAATAGTLQPVFSPCLAEGERLDMSKAELRAAIAEGTYRLALAHTTDEEVVVTGTRDRARSVVCRSQESAGTRVRRQICLTEAQWQVRDRDHEYAAEKFTWDLMELEEQATAIRMQEQRAAMNGGS